MRHAQLLLPSPLGLLEYDVLEDSVFLGPGPRDSLRAQAAPFAEAVVALTRKPDGFWVRPLPDQPQPEVNGKATGGARLADGDRIRLGGKTALFRVNVTQAKAPPPSRPLTSPSSPSSSQSIATPTTSVRQRPPTPPSRGLATIIRLAGAGLILAATLQALNHAMTLKDADNTKTTAFEFDEPTSEDTDAAAGAQSRSYKAYVEFRAFEERQRDNPREVIAKAKRFLVTHGESMHADAVVDRLRNARIQLSEIDREILELDVKGQLVTNQFNTSLEAIHRFRAKYGASDAARGIDELAADVRKQAKAFADDVRVRAGSMIVRAPRQAYRLLLSAGNALPPDLHADLIPLLERSAMLALDDRTVPEAGSKTTPKKSVPPTKKPNGSGPTDNGPTKKTNDPTSGRGDKGGSREAQVQSAWRQARKQLNAGHFDVALESYTELLSRYAKSETVKTRGFDIRNGARAARAGVEGPAGLLGVPSKGKRPKIDVTYDLSDKRLVGSDWVIDQPFASHLPLRGEHVKTGVRLRGATGLLFNIVFEADVTVEATIRASTATDFGAIAVAQGSTYRALLFNINNRDFQLKKGDAKRKEPGHILWFIGQGVWRDADPDAHGFIKLDAKSTVSIKHGDVVNLSFARNQNKCSASFSGKTDKAKVSGDVRGDDGSRMGSARVGFFTSGGDIVVETVRIRGRVDREWFRDYLVKLIESDPGPDG